MNKQLNREKVSQEDRDYYINKSIVKNLEAQKNSGKAFKHTLYSIGGVALATTAAPALVFLGGGVLLYNGAKAFHYLAKSAGNEKIAYNNSQRAKGLEPWMYKGMAGTTKNVVKRVEEEAGKTAPFFKTILGEMPKHNENKVKEQEENTSRIQQVQDDESAKFGRQIKEEMEDIILPPNPSGKPVNRTSKLIEQDLRDQSRV